LVVEREVLMEAAAGPVVVEMVQERAAQEIPRLQAHHKATMVHPESQRKPVLAAARAQQALELTAGMGFQRQLLA
jgi:hypothetical protein